MRPLRLLTFHQSWAHTGFVRSSQQVNFAAWKISHQNPGSCLSVPLAKRHNIYCVRVQPICNVTYARAERKQEPRNCGGKWTHTRAEWVPVLTRCMMPCVIIALINVCLSENGKSSRKRLAEMREVGVAAQVVALMEWDFAYFLCATDGKASNSMRCEFISANLISFTNLDYHAIRYLFQQYVQF